MNDQSTWLHQLAEWAATVLGTLLMGLAVYIRNRFKSHGTRLAKLERDSITRPDFDLAITKMSAERQRMHEENQDALNSIKTDTTATHRRIDELYRDLLNQRPQR